VLIPAPTTADSTDDRFSEELTRRKHEEFIFLYRSRERDEWVVNLNDKLDGMQVVEILQAFQTQMIELIRG